MRKSNGEFELGRVDGVEAMIQRLRRRAATIFWHVDDEREQRDAVAEVVALVHLLQELCAEVRRLAAALRLFGSLSIAVEAANQP